MIDVSNNEKDCQILVLAILLTLHVVLSRKKTLRKRYFDFCENQDAILWSKEARINLHDEFSIDEKWSDNDVFSFSFCLKGH